MKNIFINEEEGQGNKNLIDRNITLKKKAALETRLDAEYEEQLQKNMDECLRKIKTKKDKERALYELKTIKSHVAGSGSPSALDIVLFLVPIPFLGMAKSAYGNSTSKKRQFIKKLNQTISRVEKMEVH